MSLGHDSTEPPSADLSEPQVSAGAATLNGLAPVLGALAVLAVLVLMFAPLFAIDLYGASLQGVSGRGTEATVGIAVILRATARRFLRGASSNVMRTTAGALGRTSARALTRRSVKFAGRLFFGSMVSQAADEGDDEKPATAASQAFALGFGFVALCASFRGILYVVPESIADQIAASVGVGTWTASLLAGLPLLIYAGLHLLFGSWLGVRTRYRTELDGVLLQAYFTGAGSFLPLTTDVDYEGTAEAKRKLATCSILGMFVLHLLLHYAGEFLGSGHVSFLSSVTLLYAFVYCFPIRPLEGHFIWSVHKGLWLLVTLPILVAFLFWLPPVFGEIL